MKIELTDTDFFYLISVSSFGPRFQWSLSIQQIPIDSKLQTKVFNISVYSILDDIITSRF